MVYQHHGTSVARTTAVVDDERGHFIWRAGQRQPQDPSSTSQENVRNPSKSTREVTQYMYPLSSQAFSTKSTRVTA